MRVDLWMARLDNSGQDDIIRIICTICHDRQTKRSFPLKRSPAVLRYERHGEQAAGQCRLTPSKRNQSDAEIDHEDGHVINGTDVKHQC